MPHRTHIKQLRESAGLTQKQLAQRVGLHSPQLSEIEAGKRDLRVGQLRRICAALGVTMAEFFAGESSAIGPLRDGDICLVRTPEGVRGYSATISPSGKAFLIPDDDGDPMAAAEADIVSVTRIT